MSNNYIIEYLIDNVAIAVFVKADLPDKALDAAYDSLASKLDPKVNVPPAITLRNTDLAETIQNMVKYGFPGTL